MGQYTETLAQGFSDRPFVLASSRYVYQKASWLVRAHVSKLSRAALAARAHWLTVEWLPK
jgi:hypothetical protein